MRVQEESRIDLPYCQKTRETLLVDWDLGQ